MGDFRLSGSFLERFVGKQPDWGPIGYLTYKTKYARPIEGESRTEEWWETIRRVVEGTYSIQKEHCEKLRLPWNHNKAQKSAQEMYTLMWEMKFLPPGRGLWMMGTSAIEVKGAAPLYNCSFVTSKDISTQRAEPFCFLMDMSMLGVGVGYDTRGANSIKVKRPRKGDFTFQIEDTREGWIAIVRCIIDAYFGYGTIPTHIDYSQIRPHGSQIKTFGGTASGPTPLKQLVEYDIPSILGPLEDELITSEAIVDLFSAIGKCVVSGNVRRSASIALGNYDDNTFLSLKDSSLSKKHAELCSPNGWRWTANHSIFSKIGMDYTIPAQSTKKTGEIGYFWLENAQKFGRMSDPSHEPNTNIIGCNPCGEISMEDHEFCNVPETFPARHTTLDEYKRTLKFAYLYAKVVTLIPTHNDRVNAVQLRNRKIGLSMSGITQSIHKHGLREHFRWCDEGYKYLKNLDDIYKDWLCVPASKKITSVKPSGTISLLCGATPGIHFPIAEYYWRTQRFDADSPFVKAVRRAGYRVEEGEGHNTVVVYFPVKERNFWKSKSDVTIWEQLEIAAQMQAYWSDNQVSVTVTFKKDEADQILLALQLYETRLKSVSFLPLLTLEEMQEIGYKHPPYQAMTKKEYDQAIANLKPIRLANTTETQGFEKSFCDSDRCELPA